MDIKGKLKQQYREFGLTSFAVDNATSVFLITFMIMLFGLGSYVNLPKESFPEVPWPKIYINTVYFGNSASDIENLVTRPLENELSAVTEIKEITSSSLQDYSLIVAEFNADIDIDDATRKVKDAVDKARQELPTDLTQEPEVLDIDLSEIPVMTVNLSGKYSNDELRRFAEYLEEEIEALDEISQVNIKGARDREVSINVNLRRMESLEISFTDIENAIKSENVTMSGGEIVNNDFRRNIRVIGEFSDVKEIEALIVKSENQFPVYLRDIATVTFGFKDQVSIARADQLPVISLDVIKGSGQNLLDASDRIKLVTANAQEKVFPKDLTVTFFNDQSVQTRDLVSNLENSIISGVILVVLVLLFFLGIRNALFVGMAIPLSMLLGIMVLGLLGYTMNMVVLFSLILALGMLVDNAIVVVENIYRYRQAGYSGIEAAKRGTGEVAVPIIASTATTLAAFAPLAFWPGLMGSFMKYLPITLIVVLSASLFVALVVNPVFTAVFMKVDQRADDPAVRRRRRNNILLASGAMLLLSLIFHFAGVMWLRNSLWVVAAISLLNFFVLRRAAFAFQNRVLPLLEVGYDHFIGHALRGIMPYFVFGGTFLTLFLAIGLLGANMPKVILFPEADPLYVNAFVELPLGKDIEATDRLMRDIELKMETTLAPYASIVEAVLSQIGENTADPNGGPEFGASPQRARLTVSFVPSEDRNGISTREVMEKMREAVRGYPGVQIVVDQNQNGPPQGKPINLELQGEDMDKLALLAEDMMAYLNDKNVPGVEELKSDVSIGKPEMLVHIDREAARRYGTSTFGIADVMRTAVFGKEVSKFKQGEDDYPIQLRAREASRNDIDDLLNQKITFRSPSNGQISQVPVSAVANISYSSSYSAIKRKAQERVITIYSNVLASYNPNEVVEQLKGHISDYPMPEGFSYKFTGQQEEMAKEMAFLGSALGVAVFAIFLIIVAQFNSFISPFIIMLSVLFSTIGVFLGYVFTGINIEIVMTGVGIISLAGIVVNNAIVLIDYINILLQRKQEELGVANEDDLPIEAVREAIIEGGATRLRPVLLTAITTVLGLIPLAIGFNFNFFTFISDLDPQLFIGGDNAAFWGTMAWTVIYGLTFATFLTLIVVPAMYWLSILMRRGFARLLGGRPTPVPIAATDTSTGQAEVLDDDIRP